VRGNSSELDVARRRVASLQSDLNGWTSKLTTETRRASKLQQLEGQAEATQRTYEGYVQRLQQVTDLEKLQRPDARILAKATIPLKPDTPRPALDLAMGLLAGLFGAVLVAAMLEGLQRGLRTPQAVEDWTGAPCLVSVPKLSAKNMRELTALDGKGPADYVALKPLSMYSEALRQMRADLILAPADGKAPQIVLFSSAVAGEGKSTTAFAFSRTLAMSGAKTILVEADIRRPSISSVSGLSAKHSLIDVIENHDLLSKAIKKDNLTDLHVMPSRSVDDRAGVDSALERLPLLLARLREQYQFIVIDTAPVLAVAETQVMAQCADAVILIVRWGATSGDAIRLAVRELEASRIQPRGVVLNSVDLEIQSRYTRGDAASYYQYYKKYYAK
jgi:capsular exopolysaccharide synthesis family protein